MGSNSSRRANEINWSLNRPAITPSLSYREPPTHTLTREDRIKILIGFDGIRANLYKHCRGERGQAVSRNYREVLGVLLSFAVKRGTSSAQGRAQYLADHMTDDQGYGITGTFGASNRRSPVNAIPPARKGSGEPALAVR